jgi:peptide/nickel transport system permease protein
MARFLLKRFVSGVVLAVFVVTLIFFISRAFGPDPLYGLLGRLATPAQRAVKAHELGIDRPIITQFFDWAGGVLHGDLGTAWTSPFEVSRLLGNALPPTLTFAVVSVALSLMLAVGIGLLAALKRGIIDVILQLVVIVAYSLPGFWIAVMLASEFAVRHRWFPATGYVGIMESPYGWLRSITLPVVALAFGATASLAQQMRNSIIDELRQDYVRTLRSRGISERSVLLQHVLRNALGPTITVTGLQFIGALGGAVVAERVFAIKGLGSLTQNASAGGDTPLLMGMVLFTVLVVIVVNLIFDVLLGLINPKVRQL